MAGTSDTGSVPLLNRFQPGDRDTLAELLNDPAIAEFTSIPSPYTLDDADIMGRCYYFFSMADNISCKYSRF